MRTHYGLLALVLYLALCLLVLVAFGVPAITVLVISIGIGSFVAAAVVIGRSIPTGPGDRPHNRR